MKLFGESGRANAIAAVLTLSATSCAHGLFSGVQYPDHSRPVCMIETRGGVEFGATTDEGILFLGRTAMEGPCRVHYFLGPPPTPLVEDGEIRSRGGVFYEAEIDLKYQSVHILERDPTNEDDLIAIVFLGADTRNVPVRLAEDTPGIEGDVLAWPGTPLRAGTGIFVRKELPRRRMELYFVGLVTGEITRIVDGQEQHFVTFTGTDRVRELLAVPRDYPQEERVKYRPDDITVIKKR